MRQLGAHESEQNGPSNDLVLMRDGLQRTGSHCSCSSKDDIHPFPPAQASGSPQLTEYWGSYEALEGDAHNVGAVENTDPCAQFFPFVER